MEYKGVQGSGRGDALLPKSQAQCFLKSSMLKQENKKKKKKNSYQSKNKELKKSCFVVSKMSHGVKERATNPDIPKTHMERTQFWKLPSDLHTYTVEQGTPPTYKNN